MPFSFAGLNPLGGQSKSGAVPSLWCYQSSDSLATIIAASYFDTFQALLNGDMIAIVSTHATAGGMGLYRVRKSGTVITLVPRVDAYVMTVDIANISSAADFYLYVPFAGLVTFGAIMIDGAITVANAVVNLKINGVAITGGQITVTQAGSAAGSSFTCTPTAANAVVAGDKLTVNNAAGSTGAVAGHVVIVITPTQ